jgi:hypothetical protein
MALEQQQVNVQELQRLNDAITMTMDALRRVVPQLALLQQQQLQQLSPFGFGQMPFLGAPMGMGLGQDPLSAAYYYAQQQALRNLYPQQLGFGQGISQFGVPQYGASQFGIPQLGIGQLGVPQLGHPFQQQLGHPFQQIGTPWQQMGVPWQQPQISPYVNMQRPF